MARTKNLFLLFIFLLCTGLSVNTWAGPTCGDGVAEGDEECDTGVDGTDACTNTDDLGYGQCKKTFCGDGFIQSINGFNFPEVCDDGDLNGPFPAECSTSCAVNVAPTTTTTTTGPTTTTTTGPTTTTTTGPTTTTTTGPTTTTTTAGTTTTTTGPTTTTTTAGTTTTTTAGTTTTTTAGTTTTTEPTTTTTVVPTTTTTAAPTTTTAVPTTTTTTLPPAPDTVTEPIPGGGSVTITTESGEGLTDVTVAEATGDVPDGISFPLGVISLTTTVPDGADSVTVQLKFEDALPKNLKIYHVEDGVYTEIPPTGDPDASWEKIDATTVNITKLDGGDYDLDDTANGTMIDPIAVGGEASFPFFGGDGGGGCTLSSNPRASVDPIWLFLLVAPGIGYLRRRVRALKRTG